MVRPLVAIWLAAEKAPAQQLDKSEQALVLIALLSLIVLGLVLLLLGWLSVRALRYYATYSSRSRRRPSSPDEFDWARRPLISDDPTANDDRPEQG